MVGIIKVDTHMEYSYPISVDWSTNEIIDAIHFFELIEKAYESSVSREDMLKAYKRFKEIVPSIAEEKKIFKEFEEVSGFSSYHVVKQMKENQTDPKISMKKHKK